jgi:acyl dehydratase
MKRLYARIALSALRRRQDELPARELARTVAVDRSHLAAYDRVCGFRLRDELPATYPHVLAFPLALELMAAGSFPFSPLGLVHIGNRIEQLRPLRADERLDLRVWAADLAPHDRGTQFALCAEAAVDGEVVWRDRSTYLHRERRRRHPPRPQPAGPGRHRRGGGRKHDGGGEPPVASAVWAVPGDVGRRYARVSGDANPIHLHPLAAKALGQPGAIAHGMWTKARCLATLEGELPEAFAVDVRFRRPLRIPGRAAFSYRDGEFAVHDARTGTPHLSGTRTGLTGG